MKGDDQVTTPLNEIIARFGLPPPPTPPPHHLSFSFSLSLSLSLCLSLTLALSLSLSLTQTHTHTLTQMSARFGLTPPQFEFCLSLCVRVGQYVAFVLHLYLLYAVLPVLRDICIVMYCLALKRKKRKEKKNRRAERRGVTFFIFNAIRHLAPFPSPPDLSLLLLPSTVQLQHSEDTDDTFSACEVILVCPYSTEI